jgi:hypothetical protein
MLGMEENVAIWGIYSLCGVLVRMRAALGTSRQVTCIQTVLLIVSPVVAARVWT